MINALIYYLSYPLIWLIMHAPFWVVYALSDGACFLMYYVIKYRRRVVRDNLTGSFPEKSLTEIIAIEKKFYRFLCDVFLETLKVQSMPLAELAKRAYVPAETHVVFERFKDRPLIVFTAHLGHWEWPGHSLHTQGIIKGKYLYKPVKNKYFDKLFYNLRWRPGATLIAMQDTMRHFLGEGKKEVGATFFIADQSPMPEGAVWTEFLHRNTAFFAGAEKIAARFGFPVVYCYCTMPSRGHYIVHAELLTEDASKHEFGEVTKTFAHKLEENIRQQPEIWLWSHKRWKWKEPK